MNMCFSATASFTAGGILLVAGSGTFVMTHKSPERLLALVPLFFGVQQLIEGVQWFAQRGTSACTALGYGYLFFAFLVWPVYVPIVVYVIEKSQERKKLLGIFIALGATVVAYLLFSLLTNPLTVNIIGNSIDYAVDVPNMFAAVLFYVATVCGAPLFSSRLIVKLSGLLTLIAFFVTYVAFRVTFTSVWCFFAAIISVIICVDVWRARKAICPDRNILPSA